MTLDKTKRGNSLNRASLKRISGFSSFFLLIFRLWMNFDSLFNGDKTLSDSTNAFLNENWLDILNELKPVLTRTIGEIYRAIATPIFAKFPYEDLFIHDDE